MIDLTYKKILLVRNDNIGDLICTTPAIEALRKRYPDNQIDIVVNSYNYCAITQNPFVDTIYCYTKPKHKNGFLDKLKAGIEKLKILIAIKKENYDVVVIFRSDYSKSAELFSRITKATYKVGVKNLRGKDNFTIHAPIDNTKHEVEFCFDCLEKFGITYNNENTHFFVPETLVTKYNNYKNAILFHISSRKKANRYTLEKFIQIMNSFPKEQILLSAEPDDFEMAEKLAQSTHAIFIKTSSLLDLAGLIKSTKLLVTLDGGAMHVGPAVGTKTISISGETNMDKWYPWGYKDLVIQDQSRLANNIPSYTIVNFIQKILMR